MTDRDRPYVVEYTIWTDTYHCGEYGEFPAALAAAVQAHRDNAGTRHYGGVRLRNVHCEDYCSETGYHPGLTDDELDACESAGVRQV